MKKHIINLCSIIAAGVFALALASCEHEVWTPEKVGNTLPSELVASLDQEPLTRTAYDDAGKFSWLSTDAVSLILAKDLTSYSQVDAQTYTVTSLDNDNRLAVFSAGDDELNAYTEGEWKSAGIAVYPASLSASSNSNSYGAPYAVLPQSVNGEATDIVLTGVSVSDNSNFKFSTAMSVISFSLENIPSSAAQLRLYTDKASYPIDGDFKLVKGSDGKVAISGSNYAGNAHDYVYVDLSEEGAIDSRTFFFNIPVADYPAGTMYILLCDANGGQIMKRTVNVALSLSRNDCLEVPTLSYAGTVEFSGGTEYNPQVAWSIDCKQIRFCVSTSETNDPSAYDANYVFANPKTTGRYSGTNELTSYSSNKPSVSGKYYLHYILQSDDSGVPSTLDANNVVSYGTLPFYFSSEDYDFDGKYIFEWYWRGTNNDITELNYYCDPNFSDYNPNEAYMILSESDDYTKGTIMITNLWGKVAEHPVYGYVDGSLNQVIFPFAGDDDDHVFTHQTIYGHYSRIRLSQSQSHELTKTSTDHVYIYDIDESERYGGKDIVLKITTTNVNGTTVRSLFNQRFIMMTYTYEGASDWYALIYGRYFYFYKGEEPIEGTDPNMGTWIP